MNMSEHLRQTSDSCLLLSILTQPIYEAHPQTLEYTKNVFIARQTYRYAP